MLGQIFYQSWIICIATRGSHDLKLTWVARRIQLGADFTVNNWASLVCWRAALDVRWVIVDDQIWIRVLQPMEAMY